MRVGIQSRSPAKAPAKAPANNPFSSQKRSISEGPPAAMFGSCDGSKSGTYRRERSNLVFSSALVISCNASSLLTPPTINTSVPVTAGSKLSDLPRQSSHHKTMPAIRIIKEERVAQVGNAGMRKVKQEATKGGRAMKVKEDPEVDWEFQM